MIWLCEWHFDIVMWRYDGVMLRLWYFMVTLRWNCEVRVHTRIYSIFCMNDVLLIDTFWTFFLSGGDVMMLLFLVILLMPFWWHFVIRPLHFMVFCCSCLFDVFLPLFLWFSFYFGSLYRDKMHPICDVILGCFLGWFFGAFLVHFAPQMGGLALPFFILFGVLAPQSPPRGAETRPGPPKVRISEAFLVPVTPFGCLFWCSLAQFWFRFGSPRPLFDMSALFWWRLFMFVRRSNTISLKKGRTIWYYWYVLRDPFWQRAINCIL